MTFIDAADYIDTIQERREIEEERRRKTRIRAILAQLPPPPTDERDDPAPHPFRDPEGTHDFYRVTRFRDRWYGHCVCGWRSLGGKESNARRAVTSHVSAMTRGRR